jgi:3'-phosphoadenosine 5'-phosphosulfate sulfotransferase (PAPS reductase)/FAD synthetase
MKQKKLQISFSGGRTSAYMTKLILDNWKDKYDCIVTFANTGKEHPKTLDFVHNCDKVFKFNTVWLEASVYKDERKGTGFKIVSYETASRKGEPFEDVIQKYGIPNPSYLHCTRELKLAPMRSYLASLGINHKEIPTAIGIRIDEKRRISKTAEIDNIIYPLITEWPSDKQDVLDFWEDQEFDLGLDEWDGNCVGCYKKSFKKLFYQLDSDPSCLDWHKQMEQAYRTIGCPVEGTSRVFFRQNTSAERVIEMWKNDRSSNPTQLQLDLYENGGCSESCEVYETT